MKTKKKADSAPPECCFLGGRLQGRRQQEGQWRPASPFKICAPRLLHILFFSIFYLKYVAPPCGFCPPCCDILATDLAA